MVTKARATAKKSTKDAAKAVNKESTEGIPRIEGV